MPMYCKKCGAEIGEGLRVCLNCGEEVEYTSEQLKQEFSDGVVDEGYYDSDPARQVEYENSAEIQQDVKKHMWGAVLITLLIALAVLGIAIAAMAMTKTGLFAENDISDMLAGQTVVSQTQVIAPTEEEVEASAEPEPAEEPAEEPVEAAPVEEPQNNEAEAIRNLLLTKKWSTTIEGYDGDVVFKEGGKAVITAKVPVFGLTVKKDIDAKYTFTDDCVLTLTADYGGNSYGIKGLVVRNSDRELEIIRANNAGSLKLTAAN